VPERRSTTRLPSFSNRRRPWPLVIFISLVQWRPSRSGPNPGAARRPCLKPHDSRQLNPPSPPAPGRSRPAGGPKTTGRIRSVSLTAADGHRPSRCHASSAGGRWLILQQLEHLMAVAEMAAGDFPITHGRMSTSPSSSRAAQRGRPVRRCSTQMSESARIKAYSAAAAPDRGLDRYRPGRPTLLATLALHQGLQGLPEHGAALQRTAQLLGASHQFIDKRDGSAHGQKQAATPGCIHLGIIW